MAATWAVVATVDEPAPLVAAFVAHHLNQGASEVHLFLDGPDPQTVALMRDVKGCVLTRCLKEHWQAHNAGRRPLRHPMRQIINANLAYQRTTAEWLVHCDADEFIRDGRALAEELATAPEDCLQMRLGVVERVLPAGRPQQGLFDGFFRLPQRKDPWMLEPIYGELAAFLTHGLTGHSSGKSAVRSGRGLRLNIHAPETKVPWKPVTSTELLHFDGMTDLALRIKLLRRAHEPPKPGKSRHLPGRQLQITMIREMMADPGRTDALVAGLRSLRLEQVAMLELFGLIDARPFAPQLGGLQLELSVAGFDALLRQRQRGFLEKLGVDG